MLKSKRQEGGGDFTTVLNEVRGLAKEYQTKEMAKGFGKEGNRTFVWLKMEDIEVIETAPGTRYPYKATNLPLGNFSDYESSSWVALEDSIAEVLGIPTEDASLDSIIGKVITIEKESRTYDIDGEEKTGFVWKVTSADGKGGGSALDYTVGLLEGKKADNDFKMMAVGDPKVKTDGALVGQIMSGAFFANAKVTDTYNVVDGVYVKK